MLQAGTTSRVWARRRGGFTLTEIMIAMGVLAVGMGMIAAALHAGIAVHMRTIDDIMRQLIADNALAMVQTRIKHSSTNGISNDKFYCVNSSGTTKYKLGPNDLKYPTQTSGTPYGAVVLMRARGGTSGGAVNDYDVIVIPYTIVCAPGNMGTPTVETKTGWNVSGTTVTGTANIKVGYVFIDSDGKTAIATAVSGSTVTLSDSIKSGTGPLTVITYTGGNTDDRIECSKPSRTITALTPAE